MTAQLNSMVTKTLDECVPLKTFKVREQHKFGLSEKTKQSMKERDSLRQSKSNLSPSEKAVQHEKYKKMRNRVNSMIKADVIRYNEERITKAEDVNEVWKVVSDIAAPRSEARLTLNENGKIIENEGEVAEILNDYFITKIQDLKSSIDPQMMEDPIQRLEKKLANNTSTFSFKTVTEDIVLKTINGLKQKKSAGADDLTQQQLKHGAENLAGPLTKIINKSLTEGIFPKIWKQAIVTPILKKGKMPKTNQTIAQSAASWYCPRC